MDKETRKTLVSVSLPVQTVDKIDIMRGGVPRSAFLREKIMFFVQREFNKKI
nr:MAG TPA: antitoxin [Caudoviricetes sp.]